MRYSKYKFVKRGYIIRIKEAVIIRFINKATQILNCLENIFQESIYHFRSIKNCHKHRILDLLNIVRELL